MSTVGFTAKLPSAPSDPLPERPESRSAGEPLIEFPIYEVVHKLGDRPTREEVFAMVAALRGELPCTERVVQDLERDDMLEVVRINTSKTDTLAPLIGRVMLRWEAAKKAGVEFRVALSYSRPMVERVLRERCNNRFDLTKPDDRKVLARSLWLYLYAPHVRTMALREIVRQELAKK